MIKPGIYIKVYNNNRESFCPDGINIVCGEIHNGRFTLCDVIGDKIKVFSLVAHDKRFSFSSKEFFIFFTLCATKLNIPENIRILCHYFSRITFSFHFMEN